MQDIRKQNAYDLAQERLRVIFQNFDNIYISFSGGKDSGVLLNLCIDYIRKHNLKRKIGVFHMDYEIQYNMTIDYVERTFKENQDILDIYHVCVPFRVTTCTSMYEDYWRPWDEDKKAVWVRQKPERAMTLHEFPFYTTNMWDYNHLYDLYYQAGISLDRQRVASPFICEAIESLSLYRVIDPDMWGRMIGRVNGVNFSGIYGKTGAMGRDEIHLPKGYTWKSFTEFLLSTLPEHTRNRYRKKLETSIRFWKNKGGVLSDEVIQKLRERNIPIQVGESTNYKTDKKPVRMDYLDDIDIAEFKEIPTYKRMCICILRNDHVCKYMGFALTKEETLMKNMALKQYGKIFKDE